MIQILLISDHFYENNAYTLVDIIAWTSNRGIEPKNVIQIDVANTIENILRNDFSRQ